MLPGKRDFYRCCKAAAVKRGVAPHTRKQRVLAVISKLCSAFFTGYKNKICTYYIYTKYSTLPSGISVYLVPKVGIFPEAGGRGKYSLPRVQYMPIFHKEGF